MRTYSPSSRCAAAIWTSAALAILVASCSGRDRPEPAQALPTSSTAPRGTVWADGPDPCSLLDPSDIEPVTSFEVTEGPFESDASPSQRLAHCLYAHARAGATGGQVLVTILDPQSSFEVGRQQTEDPEALEGVGEDAFVGRREPGMGDGPNFAAVDMGDGGFTIALLTWKDTTASDLERLARAAGANWPEPAG